MRLKCLVDFVRDSSLTCTPRHLHPGQVCVLVQVSLTPSRSGTCTDRRYGVSLRENDMRVKFMVSLMD